MRLSTCLKSVAATAFLSSIALTAAWAQGQTRPVGDFQQLRISNAINVVVKQGSATEVRVEATPEVLSRVRTEVQDGTLKIYREQSRGTFDLNLGKQERVTVYITCPRLTGVEASGASDVKGESALTADEFSIRASGASDVALQLTAKTLTVNASGASDVRLTGRVESQRVQVSGSSDYRAYELQSQQAEVQASGASDAYVNVDGDLAMRSSGASDVHYKGKARVSR